MFGLKSVTEGSAERGVAGALNVRRDYQTGWSHREVSAARSARRKAVTASNSFGDGTAAKMSRTADGFALR